MFHSCRDIGHKALIEDEFFVFQPELNLATQIAGVIEIGPEVGEDFVEVVSMRLDAG